MSPARRVRITSPQTRVALARRHRPHPHPLPLPAPADVDEARRLLRAQRRIAVRTVVLLGVVLFGVSGLIAAFPVLDRRTLVGMPLSWLMLAVLTYPVLLLLALAHVRSAERAEDRRGRGGGEPAEGRPPRPGPGGAGDPGARRTDRSGGGNATGASDRTGRAGGTSRAGRSGDRGRGRSGRR